MNKYRIRHALDAPLALHEFKKMISHDIKILYARIGNAILPPVNLLDPKCYIVEIDIDYLQEFCKDIISSQSLEAFDLLMDNVKYNGQITHIWTMNHECSWREIALEGGLEESFESCLKI